MIPETIPETYAGFAGRRVASVEISVSPTIDPETIRPLIKQQAGQPFSAAAIRESVAALQATKRFKAVQVSIGFASNGIDVLFILQPTSYVGMLFFPGADGRIPYVELMQAANIPEQTPYYKGLLPQGEKSLLAFLHKQGYFAATVQPEIRRDDAHRVVNIIFRTDLNHRAKVGKVEIQGTTQQQASQALHGLSSLWSTVRGRSLKPGKGYSPQRIQKATNYIVSSLQSRHRLAASVRNIAPNYNAKNNRANVTFQVKPGPLVYLHVRGAHVSKGTLRREIPVEQENAANRDIARQGEQDLVSYFQGRGYPKVTVTSEYQQQADRITITYNVKLGARYNVKEPKFVGNHRYDEDRLESIVAIKQTHSIFGFRIIGGKFSKDLVDQSVASLETLYRHAGFEHASVEPKVKESGKSVQVTFAITEGLQDKVAAFRIEGNNSQPVKVLSGNKPLDLQRGEPYSPYRLDQDRNRILATYFNLGYLDATFNSKVTPSANNPHLMDVAYIIHEGPQGHISAVLPLGQKMTRPAFIRTVIHSHVSPGMPLSEGNFLTAESNLYNLDIFDWVSVKPLEPTINKPEDEVLVKVHEDKRYSMDIGAGIEIIPRSGNVPVGTVALPGLPIIGLGSKFTVSQKSFVGPRFSFALSRRDMLGRAETATVSTILSRLDQRGDFSYADPRLWNASWSALLSLSAERTTVNPIYTAVLGQASIQAEKALPSKKSNNLIFRYSFDRTDLTNILIPGLVLPEDQHVRVSTVSAEYLRDTRDNPLDAHRGMFQTFNIGITPTAFGSSQNFIRIMAQNSVYVPVQPWLTWASRLSTGFAVPFADSHVPLSERFFSGGPDSLRGFPVDGAGPQRPVQVCSDPANPASCTLISVPVGGDMLFIVNTEARFPLPLLHNLGGVFFYDGGNVYNNINLPQLASNYTNTVGAGLRYRTPVGPVRFDVGYRLTPIPGVKALQYYVTVGQSF
ncbi:MAG: POTRA domain-containing protein [Candidatus Acidiferrales bacterium]